MADQVRVSTEKLRDTARKYTKSRQGMQQACAEIRSAAESCAECWSGSASRAFQERFAAMYSELKQTDDRMQEATDGLLKSAGIFEESEHHTQEAAQALETGSTGIPGAALGVAASLFT